MNLGELAGEISGRTALTEVESTRFLRTFADVLQAFIDDDDKVVLPGFGTFARVTRAARTGRNPRTGEHVSIKATSRVAFKPSTKIEEAIRTGRRSVAHAVPRAVISEVASVSAIDPKVAREATGAMVDSILGALSEGDGVRFTGLGEFRPSQRRARAGRGVTPMGPSSVRFEADKDAMPRPRLKRERATTNAGPDELYWTTDLPNDRAALQTRTLFRGVEYRLETGLEPDESTVDDQSSTALAASDFLDKKVRFIVSGLGLELISVDDSGGPPEVELCSIPMLVTTTSTDRFAVTCRAPNTGDARIEVRMEVNDAPFETVHQLDFAVVALGASIGSGNSEPARSPLHATTAPEALVFLKVSGNPPTLTLRGFTDGDTAFDAARPQIDLNLTLRKARQDLDELAAEYFLPTGSWLDPPNVDAQLLEFARIGRELHSALFGDPRLGGVGEETRRAVSQIAQWGRAGSDQPPGNRMVIDDGTIPFPWAVLYDAGYAAKTLPELNAPEDVDLEGFWGYRYRIDRLMSTNAKRPGATLKRVRVKPFVDKASTTQPSINKQLNEKNRGLLTSLRALNDVVVQRTGTSLDAFGTWLAGPAETDVLYVYAHGQAAHATTAKGFLSDKSTEEQAVLEMGSDRATLHELGQRRPARFADQPLVILNACESVQADPLFPSPFVNRFVKLWDARAIVGGDARLPSAFAIEFAHLLLTEFLSQPRQLGECLWATVKSLLDDHKNPYGLLYALYGRSELIRPPVQRTQT